MKEPANLLFLRLNRVLLRGKKGAEHGSSITKEGACRRRQLQTGGKSLGQNRRTDVKQIPSGYGTPDEKKVDILNLELVGS